MKGYEAAARAFVAEGVTSVFGLMGDGNMYWVAAMAADPAVSVIHARHENAAVAMADGWARATGDVGVASVTCGPGLTQIGTSLAASVQHRTPLVIFTGDTPSTASFHLQAFGQRGFVESTGAVFVASRSVDGILDDIQRAFLRARRDQIPVVLSVPYDLQDKSFEWGADYVPSRELMARPAVTMPAPEAIEQLAEELAGAERPVVLAGRGAVAAGAHDELVALADRIGAVLVTSLRAKGYFDGDARNLGVAGAFSADQARELLVDSDYVVGFGARLGYFTTEGGYLFPDARIAQVDLAPAGLIDGQRVADLAITSDARLAAQALLGALDDRTDAGHGLSQDAIAASRTTFAPVPPEVAPGELDPNAVMDAINSAVPPEWRVVIGAGHFWNFAVDRLTGRPPGSYLYTYDFGVIGQGLPTAMGVAVAEPDRRVVLVEGDGSMVMNIQELESLVRHQIPLLALCINDGAYGAEVHKMRSVGVSGDDAVFGRPDLASVAQAFGARAATVTDIDQLTKVIGEFAANPAPTVVDVHVSADVISRQYRRLFFGNA
jgi:acetolactate synthase-1/2/3 large subunit